MSTNECYFSNENVAIEKAFAIKQIGKLISKTIKSNTNYWYIRRYTRVHADGTVTIKLFGLSDEGAQRFISEVFPLAEVYYSNSHFTWTYMKKWTGIPSIVIDVTNYVS